MKVISIILVLIGMTSALQLCPAGCSCEDERLLVRCHDGINLDILPITLNPSTERLIIKFNSIKLIDSSIQFYSELRLLDLSNNQIFLTEDKIFIYQHKLLQLHLNNNKIGEVNNDTFKGLVRLETLNLRSNYLMELKNGVFTTVPNVEYLNLGQNRIAKIEPEAFEGLKNLKSLYLDDNILTTIPNFAFKHTPFLAELFIGMNPLNNLDSAAFKNLANLAALDVHGSLLTNVSAVAFSRLRNLKSLDLSDNLLKNVPTPALSRLERLESLKVGQNEFDSISEGSFFGLLSLRKIDISNSKNLRLIQSGAFAANPHLEVITISSNKMLFDLPDGVFSGLPSINSVDLRNNAFTTIRKQWLPWESLKSFEIADNPLKCDCELKWLHKVLSKSKKNSFDIICIEPSRLYEENLQEISEESMGCQNESSLGLVICLFAAIVSITSMVVYKNRNYFRLKCQRKTQFVNNDADCSFEHNHIYEEIHAKCTESMANFNNAVNSNIYSFGCPYQFPVQTTVAPQPVYLPASFQQKVPIYR